MLLDTYTLLSFLAACLTLAGTCVFYVVFVKPRFDPLSVLPGPPLESRFGTHMRLVLEPVRSPKTHELFVKNYGRSVRIQGAGPWDQRLLTLDPVSVAYVLKNSHIYEKPWQSRRIITGLIGCGLIAAEGAMHKRQRRVLTPAFSIQNLRALVPLIFKKGNELTNKWLSLVDASGAQDITLDISHWISRATFDVIGSAGFDYEFNAIHDESNELFCAYRDMFETAIAQQVSLIRQVLSVYIPIIDKLFPTKATTTVYESQKVIRRVAGQLIQEKKRKIAEGEASGRGYQAKDLLTLLSDSNVSTDITPEQRISDEDILHNVNTFMFTGTDSTSLSITWTLLLLAQHPHLQTRLRQELSTVASVEPLHNLTNEEIDSLYNKVADLPYLHNVIRESLRFVPPVHSSLRMAMQDDEIPTSCPVKTRMSDGSFCEGLKSVKVAKGSLVHVPIEAFNLDREIWGDDAWEFNPDRWDNLPEAVDLQPGVFSNTLSFSAGPRSCIAMRFSLIEIKTFVYLLVSKFSFHETDAKIFKANVVLTRPYVSGKFKEGSQCPLRIVPLGRDKST